MKKEAGHERKQLYVEPRVLATYSKEELEETIRPHGSTDTYCTGGLCGTPDGGDDGCGPIFP